MRPSGALFARSVWKGMVEKLRSFADRSLTIFKQALTLSRMFDHDISLLVQETQSNDTTQFAHSQAKGW